MQYESNHNEDIANEGNGLGHGLHPSIWPVRRLASFDCCGYWHPLFAVVGPDLEGRIQHLSGQCYEPQTGHVHVLLRTFSAFCQSVVVRSSPHPNASKSCCRLEDSVVPMRARSLALHQLDELSLPSLRKYVVSCRPPCMMSSLSGATVRTACSWQLDFLFCLVNVLVLQCVLNSRNDE